MKILTDVAGMDQDVIVALQTTAEKLGYDLLVVYSDEDSVNISVIHRDKTPANLSTFVQELNINSSEIITSYLAYYGEHNIEYKSGATVTMAGAYGIHEVEEDYLLSFTINK